MKKLGIEEDVLLTLTGKLKAEALASFSDKTEGKEKVTLTVSIRPMEIFPEKVSGKSGVNNF